MARILVIEDSHAQAAALQRILRAEGFQVEVAPDGEMGLAQVRRRPFDLVLSDIVMPGMSGYEVCRQLKKDPRTCDVPVILLTALNDVTDIIKGLECGADNFITKPYDEDYLVSRIHGILERRALRRDSPGGDEGIVETAFRGRRYAIRSSRQQILDYLVSTFEDFTLAKEREHRGRLAQEALRESLRFLQSTLDALAAYIAILDQQGGIIAVNSSWRRFSVAHRLVGSTYGIGTNYLEVCAAAARDGVAGAEAIAAGIRDVMRGTREDASLEYPWPSMDGERWFLVRITRFESQGPVRVVVAHQDITERKRTEQALRESQRTLATLMSNLPGMAYRCEPDESLTMRFVSEGCTELTGYRPEDLVDNRQVAYADLIHPGDREAVQYARQAALRAGMPYRLIYRLRTASGEERWVWEQGRGVPGAGGRIEAAEGIIADITKRKLAEAAMAEEAQVSSAMARVGEELIRSVKAGDLLSRFCGLAAEVLKCDFTQVWLDQAEKGVYVAAAAHGMAAEEWESMRLLRVSRDALVPHLARLMRYEVLEESGVADHPLARLARQSGATTVLYVALRRGEELIGFLAAGYRQEGARFDRLQMRIARGIAQLASMALETARLVEELELADRFKSDFLAAMSHELRTPLNVIIGYNSLLLEGTFGALNEEQADAARRVDKSARELLDLISATLDLSRFEAERVPVHIQRLDVAALIDEVAKETGRPPEKEDLEIRWSVAPGLRPLFTDPLKLKMVLKNLVGNAIKFTEHGEVEITARPCDSGVEFSVRDTGIGIDPAQQAAIFEPFRQADSTINQRYGGAGLGLYIVRRITDILGGEITVTSEPGKGSTFSVRIPFDSGRPRPESRVLH